MVMFVWGARSLLRTDRARPTTRWRSTSSASSGCGRSQHPDGQREINELHVPVGRPVKLTMTSEDVIHSFFVPAFRIKQDVLPGPLHDAVVRGRRRPGSYHLFCAEYCGTEHSGMIGRVVVMEPARLPGAGSRAATADELAGRGRRGRLFDELGCATCHAARRGARGPVAGRACSGSDGARSTGGGTVVADEDYLRESILKPRAKVVAGFQPIMPTFEGQVERGAAAAADRLHQVAAARDRQRSERRHERRRAAATATARRLPQRRLRRASRGS